MEIIKLNIIPSGVNPTCHASQYDEGRVIRVELYEGLTPFTLQASDEIGLAIRKPDDKIVTMVVENTEDNYVDIVTTKQACAVVGANLCELTIKRSSVTIGTLNFFMQVERDPLADGDDSESEIRDLQERVNACVEIALEDLYDGTSVLFDAEPVLDHDEPYTVTSNGIAQAFGAVNTALEGKVDNSYLTTNYYNKTQVDGALNGKVNNSVLEYYYTKNETYSKNEINSTLANYYTKSQVDTALEGKVDNSALNNYYLKSETYSKGEVNNLISPLTNNTCSVTKGPNMPANFPLPTVNRYGKMVTINFAVQFPAGTYANTDVLWTLSPAPISTVRVLLTTGTLDLMNVTTDGAVKFNSNKTFNNTTWVIGSFSYITT